MEAHDEEEQGGPHEPVQRLRRDPEQDEPAERQEADQPVVTPKQRIGDPATVELAERKEVQRRDEESRPTGHGHRMEEDVHASGDGTELQMDEQLEEQWSVLGKIPSGDVMQFGDPLLLKLLVHLKFGAIPAGMDVFLHPVAVAGWAGFFVTALNLFPLGQLDGGRIAYALFGRHHRMVGFVTFGGLILLGIVTQSLNWFVWAALLFFLVGFHHTPPLDDVTPLTTGRRVLGWACLILLVLLIPPVPIAFSSSVR